MRTIFNVVRRFFQWLFGAPFKALPPEFGDEVPSDLRVFEAEAEAARHETREEPAPEAGPAKPAP